MTLKSWCVICIISSPFLDVWFQYISQAVHLNCATLLHVVIVLVLPLVQLPVEPLLNSFVKLLVVTDFTL